MKTLTQICKFCLSSVVILAMVIAPTGLTLKALAEEISAPASEESSASTEVEAANDNDSEVAPADEAEVETVSEETPAEEAEVPDTTTPTEEETPVVAEEVVAPVTDEAVVPETPAVDQSSAAVDSETALQAESLTSAVVVPAIVIDPTITLAEPNGVHVAQGQSYMIDWDTQIIPADYRNHTMYLISVETGEAYALIADDTTSGWAGISSFTWRVGTTFNTDTITVVPPGEYRIRVQYNDAFGVEGLPVTVNDETATTIIVDGENTENPSDDPSVTLVAPNGGQTLVRDTNTVISWTTAHMPANVKFIALGLLTPDNSPYAIIADNHTLATSSLSYDWHVGDIFTGPSDLIEAGSYKVNVCYFLDDESLTKICDAGDATVTIVNDGGNNQTDPSVTVTSPNGGETWHRGETKKITWTAEHMPESMRGFDIAVINSDGDAVLYVKESVGPSERDLREYDWKVFRNIILTENDYTFTTGTYSIRVCANLDGAAQVCDDSATLTLDNTPVDNNNPDDSDDDNDSSGRRSSGGRRTPRAVGGTETGLPAIDFCTVGGYLKNTVIIGGDNATTDVLRVQLFLRLHEGMNVAVTGVYDTQTIDAVKVFQTKYASEILAPWGLTMPTGHVGILTALKINALACGNTNVLNVNPLSFGETVVTTNTDTTGFATVTDTTVVDTATTSSTTAQVAAVGVGLLNFLSTYPWWWWLIVIILILTLINLIRRGDDVVVAGDDEDENDADKAAAGSVAAMMMAAEREEKEKNQNSGSAQ